MSGSVSVPDAYRAQFDAAIAAHPTVPPAILAWQLQQESSWNPLASNAGNYGVAQLSVGQNIPGVGPVQSQAQAQDPAFAINAAAALDESLYRKTGSWGQALYDYGTLPHPGQPGYGTVQANFAAAFPDDGANANANAFGWGGAPGVTPSPDDPNYSKNLPPGGAVSGANIPAVLSSASGWIEEYVTRGFVLLVGLALLIVALVWAMTEDEHGATFAKLAVAAA